MLREINRQLRKVVLIIGSLLMINAITKDRVDSRKGNKHGYQAEEFDDIW